MSPIGRAFTVLNLLLAGGFVLYAGNNLERDAYWKNKHKEETSALQEQVSNLESQNQVLVGENEDAKRQLTASETAKGSFESQLAEARNENESLRQALNAIEGNVTQLRASYETVSSSIDRATEDAKQARADAIAANQERDSAVAAKDKAQADLRDANDTIAQLNDRVGERDSSIASLEDTIRQKDILLDVVRIKAPGLIAAAVPVLAGTVERVDAAGKLVTVLVTENPADADISAGYSFAIYNAGSRTYKGEAMVQSVDGNYAFCRVTTTVPGASIQAGDQAATQTY